MTSLIFDSSIFLGQFSPEENIRVLCKNVICTIPSIDNKEGYGLIVETFEENSRTDHIIWKLQRGIQDIFFPYMDVFHSVKKVDRLPLDKELLGITLSLIKDLNISDISCAYMIAVAKKYNISRVYSFYNDFTTEAVKKYLIEEKIELNYPLTSEEMHYQEIQKKGNNDYNLEELYKNTLSILNKEDINLLQLLFNMKNKGPNRSKLRGITSESTRF